MIFSGKKGSEASSDSVKVAIFPERRKRRRSLSDGSDRSDESDKSDGVGRGGQVDPSNILTIITG